MILERLYLCCSCFPKVFSVITPHASRFLGCFMNEQSRIAASLGINEDILKHLIFKTKHVSLFLKAYKNNSSFFPLHEVE